MKVSVISRWYNEEFFAPFFLGHYAWADEIIVLLDTTTTDKSAELVGRYPNARVEMKDTGGVLNDRVLSDMMSDYAAASKSDWVIRADADELTFPIGFQNPREALEQADGNVIDALYRWIFRHHTEGPLDPTQPAVLQRRHGGEYTIWAGMGHAYLKPTIVRPEANVRWWPGEQLFEPNPKVKMSTTVWDGVHWQTADVEQWVKRNAANDRRLSPENKAKGWGVKNFTEEMIRAECKKHENDPRLF